MKAYCELLVLFAIIYELCRIEVGIIYHIVFPDGSDYVGKTYDIKRRLYQHSSLATESNSPLSVRIRDFGLEREFVEYVFEGMITDAELSMLETVIIRNIKPSLNVQKYEAFSPMKFSHQNPKRQTFKRQPIPGTSQKISIDGEYFDVIGNRRKNSNVVYQYALDDTLVAVYTSSREAARNLGVTDVAVSKCCRGSLQSVKGFRFSYFKLNPQTGSNVDSNH